ncbi:TadE/TadG family type IV pilus assembly protein [Sphingobium sp.]|uniref:TadE/TadG family type IV pilus assembly protein n=1 Tax=Sphingobium sp. TaxID=1912891 RepID=UPI003B3AA2E8
MNRLSAFRHRLIGDRRGASIPEFALIMIPLFLLILGGLDMGYQIYVRSVLLGAMERATRLTTLQTVDNDAVENDIESTVKGIAPYATVVTTKGSFNNYSNINTMERLTKDVNGNNVLDSGDCWEDIDDNGIRNVVVSGKANSIGGADDIVRYETKVTYKRILPVWRMIGVSDTVSMTANTLTKRQPYEKQDPVVPKCKL